MADAEKPYNDLDAEEREIRNKEIKAREAAEQASESSSPLHSYLTVKCPQALPYAWRQELGDVDISVPVPKGTRGRDLDIKLTKKGLAVGLKGKEKIMEGVLCQEIKVEDSTWTLRKFRLIGSFWYCLAPSPLR